MVGSVTQFNEPPPPLLKVRNMATFANCLLLCNEQSWPTPDCKLKVTFFMVFAIFSPYFLISRVSPVLAFHGAALPSPNPRFYL